MIIRTMIPPVRKATITKPTKAPWAFVFNQDPTSKYPGVKRPYIFLPRTLLHSDDCVVRQPYRVPYPCSPLFHDNMGTCALGFRIGKRLAAVFQIIQRYIQGFSQAGIGVSYRPRIRHHAYSRSFNIVEREQKVIVPWLPPSVAPPRPTSSLASTDLLRVRNKQFFSGWRL
jgi:hypothetical protein